MKHSTFRKGSLISSVALLLVAIVALSGATFAWFSQNENVTAGTIDMTASSGSGFYIAEAADVATRAVPGNAAFGSEVVWEASTAKFNPASCAFDGTNLTYDYLNSSSTGKFFTTSTDLNNGAWNGEDITVAAANSDYIVKQVWVKAASTTPTTLTCTVKVDGTDSKGYERIAIVDGTDPDAHKLVGVYASAADSAAALKSATVTDNKLDVTTINATNAGGTDGYDVPLVETAADLSTARCYYVYCWFEGQDANCNNDAPGGNLKLDLEFGA